MTEGEKRRDGHHLSRHCHLENHWKTTGSIQFTIRELNIDSQAIQQGLLLLHDDHESQKRKSHLS